MEKVQSVQALRGIAALMVCAFHFLGPHIGESLPKLVRDIADRGTHGVTIFFVISGFVLPLSMSRAAYRVSDFPRFVLKRLMRLEPPYLVSIAFALLLMTAASMVPGFRGHVPTIDWWGVVAHLGYVAPFVGKDWIVTVYWTLLIEAQFYLLIGLTYPLLIRRPLIWILGLLLPCALTTTWNLLPHHLPSFLVGMTAFAWRGKWMTTAEAVVATIVALVVLFSYRGPEPVIFTLLAGAFILWAIPRSPVLLFLGSISYSLYLIHLPIGYKTINLLSRLLSGTTLALIAAASAFVLSILGAWLMWRLVEQPSVAWAGRVSYRR